MTSKPDITCAHWSCRWLCLRCSRFTKRLRQRGSTWPTARRFPSPIRRQSSSVRGRNGSARRSHMGGETTPIPHRSSRLKKLTTTTTGIARQMQQTPMPESDAPSEFGPPPPDSTPACERGKSCDSTPAPELGDTCDVLVVSTNVLEQMWLPGPFPVDHHLTYLYVSTRQPKPCWLSCNKIHNS